MATFKLSNITPVTILLISVLSILPYFTLEMSFPFVIKIFVQIFILIILFVIPRYSVNMQKLVLIRLMLLWYIFSFVRGLFIAETYWDWKGLFTMTLGMFIPLIVFTSINIKMTRNIFRFYILYTLPLFFVLGLFISGGGKGFFLTPISIMVLFLPLLSKELKFVVVVLSIFIILNDLGARSNVIKFTIPYILLSFYYIRIFRSKKLMEIIRNIFFIAPILLFALAVSGNFNVFRMSDYVEGDYAAKEIKEGKEGTTDLTADTRTFIYIEVLQTAVKYNSWWIGRSMARGYETIFFRDEMLKTRGRPERLANEVAILNIFTWTGLVGVIFYFLVFYQASYLAINRSNNIFIKIMGVFVAFRWLYGWVEDPNFFTSTTFVLWLGIGLCYSEKFRKMNNLEVKLWVRGIKYKSFINASFIK